MGGPAGGDRCPPTADEGGEPRAVRDRRRSTFPGEAAADAPKRLFRLTRTQLDLTTKTLLPAQLRRDRASRPLPRDPLQTNYEYADNLSFNAGQLHAVHEVGRRRSPRGVRAKPASVIDCAASGNAPACLQQQARSASWRARFAARRPTRSSRASPTSSRASVAEVGLPTRPPIWSIVTLTSPSYVFRDEVLTDAAGLAAAGAAAAEHHLHAGRRAARGARAVVGDAERATLRPPTPSQQTIDQVLATPRGARQAAALLHRLARGQGARRVHDRDQRLPRVHARGGRGGRRGDASVPRAPACRRRRRR